MSKAVTPSDFYRIMYADAPGWWHVTTIEQIGDRSEAKMLGTFEIADDIDAMLSAVEYQNGEGLYVVAAAGTESVTGGRTTGADTTLIPFLWLDADAVHGVHKTTEGLLRDLDHLKELLDRFPLLPTAVVDSGGGWYPLWKLAEPIDAQADGKWWLDRWHTTWARIARELSVHLDNTADLPRLLRMVGSLNTKFPEDAQPEVRVIFLDASRQYGLDDLDQALDLPEVRAERVELDPARPGDDYSAQATIGDLEGILSRAGFRDFRSGGHKDLGKFSRPGKPGAPTGSIYQDDDALRVVFWSSDTEVTGLGLETGRGYAAFQLLAFLEHGGDFDATASTLRADGYGTQSGGVAISIDGERVEPFPIGLRYTDTDNAERFLHLHRDRVRYVLAWGSWIVWDGSIWRRDPKAVLAEELAKDVARGLYLDLAADPSRDGAEKLGGWAKQSAGAARISAMVKLARGMPGIIIDHEQLDADSWAFGVANGWVDLRDGSHHPPDPSKLMTMAAPVAFDPEATAPRWLQALEEWLPAEVRGYFQRLVGEAIVGTVRDHILVLHYGTGGNGKGTAIDTLRSLLGPYFVVPDKSLITQVKWDRHPTEKAALFRTRLAVAAETESTIKLAEASVKELTGGDRLSARKMREDPWGFDPTHTLWLHTNHLPEIAGTDEGIWRRVIVMPWTEQFEGDSEDTALGEKLADELPGILNWAIAGASAWQAEGLAKPSAVTEASEHYREEQDQVMRFLEAMGYRIADGLWCPSNQLMQDWSQWTEDETGRSAHGRVLAARLRSLGLQKDARRPPRWLGIGKSA